MRGRVGMAKRKEEGAFPIAEVADMQRGDI